MKKFMILASLFVMAAAVVSCEKDENADNFVESKGIKVIATTPVDTRVDITPNGDGFYSVAWDKAKGAEQVRIYYAYGTGAQAIGNWGNDPNVEITVEEDGVGYFKLAYGKTSGETKVWVLYPQSATKNSAIANRPFTANTNEIYTTVNAVQTCGVNAPDKSQILLFSKLDYPDGGQTTAPFVHMMSYIKLNFKGLETLDGNKITQVKFTVNDADAVLAAEGYTYDPQTLKFKSVEAENLNLSNAITVNAPNEGIDKNGDHNIWIAAIPSYDKVYRSITVEVTLGGKTYAKTFDSSNGVQLNVGRIRPINVDMTGATAK